MPLLFAVPSVLVGLGAALGAVVATGAWTPCTVQRHPTLDDGHRGAPVRRAVGMQPFTTAVDHAELAADWEAASFTGIPS
jgi:hypothetical protein